MTIKIRLSDLILIGLACYLAETQTPWAFVIVPVILVNWIFNPRWSKSTGWRFKHDQ